MARPSASTKTNRTARVAKKLHAPELAETSHAKARELLEARQERIPEVAPPVAREAPLIRFMIPIRLNNPLNADLGNSRLAAIRKSRENASQRETGYVHTIGALARARVKREGILPALVRFTRLSSGHLDDDNLPACFKRIRDGVADALGVDDGGPFVRFEYAQRKGPPKTHAIMVEIQKEHMP